MHESITITVGHGSVSLHKFDLLVEIPSDHPKGLRVWQSPTGSLLLRVDEGFHASRAVSLEALTATLERLIDDARLSLRFQRTRPTKLVSQAPLWAWVVAFFINEVRYDLSAYTDRDISETEVCSGLLRAAREGWSYNKLHAWLKPDAETSD